VCDLRCKIRSVTTFLAAAINRHLTLTVSHLGHLAFPCSSMEGHGVWSGGGPSSPPTSSLSLTQPEDARGPAPLPSRLRQGPSLLLPDRLSVQPQLPDGAAAQALVGLGRVSPGRQAEGGNDLAVFPVEVDTPADPMAAVSQNPADTTLHRLPQRSVAKRQLEDELWREYKQMLGDNAIRKLMVKHGFREGQRSTFLGIIKRAREREVASNEPAFESSAARSRSRVEPAHTQHSFLQHLPIAPAVAVQAAPRMTSHGKHMTNHPSLNFRPPQVLSSTGIKTIAESELDDHTPPPVDLLHASSVLIMPLHGAMTPLSTLHMPPRPVAMPMLGQLGPLFGATSAPSHGGTLPLPPPVPAQGQLGPHAKRMAPPGVAPELLAAANGLNSIIESDGDSSAPGDEAPPLEKAAIEMADTIGALPTDLRRPTPGFPAYPVPPGATAPVPHLMPFPHAPFSLASPYGSIPHHGGAPHYVGHPAGVDPNALAVLGTWRYTSLAHVPKHLH